MHQCCVFGCRRAGVHLFPRDEQLRKQWVLATRRKNFRVAKHSKICSAHFKPEDYLKEGFFSGLTNVRRRLRKGAVPTWSKIEISTASKGCPKNVNTKNSATESSSNNMVGLDHSYSVAQELSGDIVDPCSNHEATNMNVISNNNNGATTEIFDQSSSAVKTTTDMMDESSTNDKDTTDMAQKCFCCLDGIGTMEIFQTVYKTSSTVNTNLGVFVSDILNSLLNIKVEQNPSFDHLICGGCLQLLTSYHDFKIKVLQSYNALLEAIHAEQSKVLKNITDKHSEIDTKNIPEDTHSIDDGVEFGLDDVSDDLYADLKTIKAETTGNMSELSKEDQLLKLELQMQHIHGFESTNKVVTQNDTNTDNHASVIAHSSIQKPSVTVPISIQSPSIMDPDSIQSPSISSITIPSNSIQNIPITAPGSIQCFSLEAPINTPTIAPISIQNTSIIAPTSVETPSIMTPTSVQNSPTIIPPNGDLNSSIIAPTSVQNPSSMTSNLVHSLKKSVSKKKQKIKFIRRNPSIIAPSSTQCPTVTAPISVQNSPISIQTPLNMTPSFVQSSPIIAPNSVQNSSIIFPTSVQNLSSVTPSLVQSSPIIIVTSSVQNPSVAPSLVKKTKRIVSKKRLMNKLVRRSPSTIAPISVQNTPISIQNTSVLAPTSVQTSSSMPPSSVQSSPILIAPNSVQNSSIIAPTSVKNLSRMTPSLVQRSPIIIAPSSVQNSSIVTPGSVESPKKKVSKKGQKVKLVRRNPVPILPKPEVEVIIIEKESQASDNDALLNGLEDLYTCRICGEKKASKLYLRRHLAAHRRTPVSCEICDKKLSSSDMLKRHMMIHIGKRFPCNICDKGYTSNYELKQHMNIHEMKQTYPCDHCDMIFLTSIQLRNHMGTVRRKEKFMCEICGQRLYTKEGYEVHMVEHKENADQLKPLSCEFCGKRFMFDRYLKKHELIHKADKPMFTCEVCGKGVSSDQNLRKHLMVHFGKEYHCAVCDEGFTEMYELTAHMNFHEEEKKEEYLCSHCGEVFLDIVKLKQHQADLKRIKCFTCHKCGKSMSHKANYEFHMMTHIEDQERLLKSLKCFICGKMFAHQKLLRTHIWQHTSQFRCQKCNLIFSKAKIKSHNCQPNVDEPFADHLPNECRLCGLILPNVNKMDQHMNKHTTRCKRCDKTFRKKNHLINHLQKRVCLRQKYFRCMTCHKINKFDDMSTHDCQPKNEPFVDFLPNECRHCWQLFTRESDVDKHVCETYSELCQA